jgi:hypothetical protein
MCIPLVGLPLSTSQVFSSETSEASTTRRDQISAIWVVVPDRRLLLLPPRLDHRVRGVDAFLLDDDDAAADEPDSEEYTCTPKMGSSSMTDVGVADAKTNCGACCRPLGAVGGQQAATPRIPDEEDDDVVVDDASWLLVLMLPLNGESFAAMLGRAVPGASPIADPDPDALEQLDVTVRIGGGRRLVKGDCAAKLGVRMSNDASSNACLGGADEGGLKYGRHGDPCPCCPLSRSSSLTAKTWSGGGGDGGDGDGPTDAPAPPRDSHDRAALDPPLGLP